MLDSSGRFVLDASDRFGKIGEENVFYLSDDVFLSQRDVRELQFAKASIATGWGILCRDLGVEPEEISQVLLGGSFGSYLSAASAVKIGLVPKLPLVRIVSAGNVAGEGAKIAALSVTERAAANAILDEVEYVELSGRADFNDLFIDQLGVPGMTHGRRQLRRARAAREEDRRRAAAGTSRCGRCRRSCTTGPRRSAPRSKRPPHGDDVVVAYAHCGADLTGYAKLPGAHCYEVYGAEHEPATYFLTDFLVRSFDHVVWRSLGLDRYPGAARRLLRQLRAGRLARAGADARAARAGRSARLRSWACRSKCERPATRGLEQALERLLEGTRVLINELPRYEILDEAAMEELERGWRRIVSELGIEFLYEDALDVLPGRRARTSRASS